MNAIKVCLSDKNITFSVQYENEPFFFFGRLSRHKTKLKMSFALSLCKPGICLCPRGMTLN